MRDENSFFLTLLNILGFVFISFPMDPAPNNVLACCVSYRVFSVMTIFTAFFTFWIRSDIFHFLFQFYFLPWVLLAWTLWTGIGGWSALGSWLVLPMGGTIGRSQGQRPQSLNSLPKAKAAGKCWITKAVSSASDRSHLYEWPWFPITSPRVLLPSCALPCIALLYTCNYPFYF